MDQPHSRMATSARRRGAPPPSTCCAITDPSRAVGTHRISQTFGGLFMDRRKPGCGGCKPGLLSGSPLIRQPAGFKQGRSPPTAAGTSIGKYRGGARRETNYAIPMTPRRTHGGSVQHMVAAVMGGKAPVRSSCERPRDSDALPTFMAAANSGPSSLHWRMVPRSADILSENPVSKRTRAPQRT